MNEPSQRDDKVWVWGEDLVIYALQVSPQFVCFVLNESHSNSFGLPIPLPAQGIGLSVHSSGYTEGGNLFGVGIRIPKVPQCAAM